MALPGLALTCVAVSYADTDVCTTALPETLSELRPVEPSVLPSRLDNLVVAAETNVGAIAVADLQRLVLGKTPSGRCSDTRAGLFCGKIRYAAEARDTAPPEVTVKRCPSAELEVAAQMTFQSADRLLCLWLRQRYSVRSWIRSIKPRPSVRVE